MKDDRRNLCQAGFRQNSSRSACAAAAGCCAGAAAGADVDDDVVAAGAGAAEDEDEDEAPCAGEAGGCAWSLAEDALLPAAAGAVFWSFSFWASAEGTTWKWRWTIIKINV